MELLFPLLIVFMIGMLFVSSRQRKKQAQQHEALQNSVGVGDVVVMTSGISGTVVDVDDEKTIDLEIAPDVITTWLRAAVREKLTPVGEHVEDGPESGYPGALGSSTPGTNGVFEHDTVHAGSAEDTVATTPAPPTGTSSTSTHASSTPTASTTAPTGASGRNGTEPTDEVSSPRSS